MQKSPARATRNTSSWYVHFLGGNVRLWIFQNRCSRWHHRAVASTWTFTVHYGNYKTHPSCYSLARVHQKKINQYGTCPRSSQRRLDRTSFRITPLWNRCQKFTFVQQKHRTNHGFAAWTKSPSHNLQAPYCWRRSHSNEPNLSCS